MKFYVYADVESDKWHINMKTGDKLNTKIICFIIYNAFDDTEIERHCVANSDDFIDYLLLFRQKNAVTCVSRIYFHNLRFDLKFLADTLNRRSLKWNPIIAGSRIIDCKIYLGKKLAFQICDSYAILDASIHDIGLGINYEKLDMENDALDIYCYKDCEIAQRGMLKFIEICNEFKLNMNMTNVSLTVSSNAFKILFKLNEDLVSEQKVEKDGKETIRKVNRLIVYSKYINDYFRERYFGGRTECFNFNIGINSEYQDYNSKYGDVMARELYPIPPYTFFDIEEKDDMKNVRELYGDKIFAYECDVNEEGRKIPIFPERIKMKNEFKTIFRASEKHALLFKKEYEYCIINKIPINNICRIWVCDMWKNIFPHVKPLYERRMKIKEIVKKTGVGNIFELVIKKIINATYGKFAEKNIKDESIILPHNLPDFLEQQAALYAKGFELAGVTTDSDLYRHKSDQTRFVRCNVAFACMITAYARLDLAIALQAVEYATLFYCDTDSIISNTFIEDNNILGGMKLEHICKIFLCINCKVYLFYEQDKKNVEKDTRIIKAKGMPVKTLKKLSDTFDISVDNIIIRPATILECINKNMDFQSVVNMNKHYVGVYEKRKICDDLSTEPWSYESPADYKKINEKNYKVVIKLLNAIENKDTKIYNGWN